MQLTLVAQYLLHCRRRHLTATTIKSYGSTLRMYVRNVDPMTATCAEIEQWLDSRTLGPRARFTYVSTISGYHTWLVDEGWAADNPGPKLIRPKLPRRLPRPIPTADLGLALSRANRRTKLWLCLAAYQGLRCFEIANLRVDNISLIDQTLHLTATKGGKDRVVPLGGETLAALEAFGVPPSGFVFPHVVHGKPTAFSMRPSTVSVCANEFLHRQGIPSTMHQLRHWFGTNVYQATSDLRLVQGLMGHSDPSTTAGYVELTPSAAAFDAVRSLRAGSARRSV